VSSVKWRCTLGWLRTRRPPAQLTISNESWALAGACLVDNGFACMLYQALPVCGDPFLGFVSGAWLQAPRPRPFKWCLRRAGATSSASRTATTVSGAWSSRMTQLPHWGWAVAEADAAGVSCAPRAPAVRMQVGLAQHSSSAMPLHVGGCSWLACCNQQLQGFGLSTPKLVWGCWNAPVCCKQALVVRPSG
jgi:hypothetical protein